MPAPKPWYDSRRAAIFALSFTGLLFLKQILGIMQANWHLESPLIPEGTIDLINGPSKLSAIVMGSLLLLSLVMFFIFRKYPFTIIIVLIALVALSFINYYQIAYHRPG